MKTSKLSRENYLIQATDIMRKSLFKPKGYKVPKVELSISWATRGNRNRKGNAKTLGQCFPKQMHAGGINQIVITPNYDGSTIKGSLDILGTLVHELVHAVDNCVSGHGKAFKDCATAVGLTGPMRSTGESEELKEYLRKNIIDKLGLFPHKKVTLNGTKKQTTRNIKVACDCCDFSFRTSRKNLAIMDFEPDCLACSEGTLHEA
ncbi:MAG: hypothetical protein ACPGU8_04010 [Methylophilaceae bacterium]